MQVLPDLPAFVAVFERLFWLVIHLTERMLGITNGFTDNFQRLGHSLILFLGSSSGRREECCRVVLAEFHFALILASAASSDSIIRLLSGKSIQSFFPPLFAPGGAASALPGKNARAPVPLRLADA